jgi:hypothetical protein
MATEITTRKAFANGGEMLSNVEAVRKAICDATAAVCTGSFGATLHAIVLTGSLARNEATMVREPVCWRLLGDADFLVVFRGHARHPATPELERLAASIENRLSAVGIVAHIGLGAVDDSYFTKLPPHSFTYELKACGQVVAGDRNLLSRIPGYRPEQLSREDAWRTVSNRMIELLGCFEGLGFPSEEISPELEYATVKLYLDMATSYLIFAGGYEPTYAGRNRRLRALAEGPTASAPFSLQEFSEHVSRSTEWKIEGPRREEKGWDFVATAMGDAQQLWRWEALQLVTAEETLPTQLLLKELARRQTAAQRVRGWLSLLRCTGWHKNCRSWPRWGRLIRIATPRYLVYQVAAELFFRLPNLAEHGGEAFAFDADWMHLRMLLPMVPPATELILWQQLITDIKWNYNRFLLGTRA